MTTTEALVYWEDDPTRTRAVTHVCGTCSRFLRREYGRTLDYNGHIVSPTGTVHVQHDFNEGHTACGKDATGDGWWWRV